jgi:hypothetical protein
MSQPHILEPVERGPDIGALKFSSAGSNAHSRASPDATAKPGTKSRLVPARTMSASLPAWDIRSSTSDSHT